MKLTMLLGSRFYRVKMHFFNLGHSVKYSNLRKFSGFVTTSQSWGLVHYIKHWLNTCFFFCAREISDAFKYDCLKKKMLNKC